MTANTWYNGMVTSVYQYDPYGQVELGSTEHTEFYGYNGESYNPNTGLEYLRARYYNADQGRFFQEDTYLGDIYEPLTLNRYAYGKNSPLNYVDPSGHAPRDAWDAPHNYLPDDREMARMGSDFYEQWSNLYRNAKTTDQKWELIDFKNDFLSATDGTLIQDIADFIVENPVYGGGAIAGGAFVLIVLIGSGGTAGMAGAPFMTAASVTIGMAGVGSIAGTSYNEYKKGEIEKQLREKYDVDISNIKLYNLDKMPEEVWDLCEKYTDYERKNQLYEDLSMRALQFATVLYAAEAVYQMGITLEEYLANRNADKMGTVVAGDSDSYKAPEGGGGITDKLKVGDIEVSFGHGGRHLEGIGLSPEEVNQVIAKDVVAKNRGTGQFYKGQIIINGVEIEYTSYGVKDGLINVGTYYPVH